MVALAGLGCLSSLSADGRTWTNDQGVEMEGELVRVRESDLVLKLADGRQVSIPLKVLSGEDAAYVREWEESRNNHSVSAQDVDLNEKGSDKSPESGVVIPSEKTEMLWPKQVPVPAAFFSKVVQESPSFAVYESDHFHFESPQKLSEEEKELLISQFEGALLVLSKLPFELPLARRESGPYIVQIFFNSDDYVKAGGKRKTRVSMTPSRLMVHLKRNSRGKSVGLSDVKPMGTLSDWVSRFSGDVYWFGEGFQEYMKSVPLTKRGCNFSDWSKVIHSIPRSIRRERLALPPLEKIMSYKGSIASEGERNQTRMRYGALVSAIYFLRMDGEGNGVRMRKYIKALQAGENHPVDPIKFLLDGRSWGDLEREMIQAWKKRGVSLRFENGDENQGMRKE